jgi:hypothetical protein
MGIPWGIEPAAQLDGVEPCEVPAVRDALEAIDRGGFIEAVARVGALMALKRGEFPLNRLEKAGDLIQSDPLLSEVTLEEARRARTEQSTIVALEPGRAVETLPVLVADDRDRERLIDLMDRASAMVDLNAEQAIMLGRIRRALTPGARANRKNGKSGSRRHTLTSP